MDKEKLENLLRKMSDSAKELPRPELCQEIKELIPVTLGHHRGLDTINIIIDLRISRLAAAAAIIITVILCANFLGRSASPEDNLFQNSKVMLKYFLSGEKETPEDVFSNVSELYQQLVPKNKDVEYFGDSIKVGDSEVILMYWKLPDGTYKVIFGDLQAKTITADELIKLQAKVLKKEMK